MIREKSGNFYSLSQHRSSPLLSFNLMISVSMLFQEFMENFLKSGRMKVENKWPPCLRAAILLVRNLSSPIFLGQFSEFNCRSLGPNRWAGINFLSDACFLFKIIYFRIGKTFLSHFLMLTTICLKLLFIISVAHPHHFI